MLYRAKPDSDLLKFVVRLIPHHPEHVEGMHESRVSPEHLKEIFSIAEAEAELIVEPGRVADDVGWESISVIAGRLAPHRPTLPLVAST